MNIKIERRKSQSNLKLHDNPVLNRVLNARGLSSRESLDFSLSELLPFQSMKGIKSAVSLLKEALEQQKRLLIVGDFDADGATSTAVAITGLKALGAKNVDFLVPNRFEYGYGLTPEIVEAGTVFSPDVIITVDNGIASVSGVEAANANGWQVLVTDHHLAPDILPNAAAIVNPNQSGCQFPSKNLAGVGVIFYVLLALRAELREADYFSQQGIAEPNLAELLDLVALGTVADVVTLDDNNRILVQQGLMRIRAGACRPGIKALIKVSGKNQASLSSEDFGFALAPRLNAAGRLDDMALGINCLLAEDESIAFQQACILEDLNKERRSIQQSMVVEAQKKMEQVNSDIQNNKIAEGLCLYHADWHQGIVGLVASRIKEQFHRPVIAFADENDEYLKGSARSIPGIHIRDILDAIATSHPNVLQKFGGHAMAAGLSIAKKDLLQFEILFSKEVGRVGGKFLGARSIETDGALDERDLNLSLAELIKTSIPWGQNFPAPIFDDVFQIIEQRILGEQHLKLVVKKIGGIQNFNAIAFSVDRQTWPSDKRYVKLVFKLSVNEYRGIESLQLIVDYMEPMDSLND